MKKKNEGQETITPSNVLQKLFDLERQLVAESREGKRTQELYDRLEMLKAKVAEFRGMELSPAVIEETKLYKRDQLEEVSLEEPSPAKVS